MTTFYGRSIIIILAALLAIFATSAPSPLRPAPTKSSPVVIGDAAHKQTLHKAVHLISQHIATDGDKCTATAIGPHALLTATHCELAGEKVTIDGTADVKLEARIVGRMRDDNDHTIYFLEGVTFSEVATFAGEPASSGDDVFMWGNPVTYRDLFRKGYVSGTKSDIGDDDVTRLLTLYDMHINHGDSGAAIFDSEGHIVSVVSFLVDGGTLGSSFSFAASYPLAFSKVQIEKARSF